MSEAKPCDVCGMMFRGGYRHDCVLQGKYDLLATEYDALKAELKQAQAVIVKAYADLDRAITEYEERLGYRYVKK